MTLRQQRVAFTRLLVDLLVWIRQKHPAWEIALDEGRVISPRLVRTAEGLSTLPDGVHRNGSRHHEGCAQDLLLYIDGTYIRDGARVEWQEIGAQWESMHPEARWGGRWGDANHVSLRAADGRM